MNVVGVTLVAKPLEEARQDEDLATLGQEYAKASGYDPLSNDDIMRQDTFSFIPFTTLVYLGE